MAKLPSIKKNLAYSMAYQILLVILPFITAPYVARVIGPDGAGIQSYTASIQAYFIMFAALGTLSYGTREISRARDDAYTRSKLFWEIEIMTMITSGISLAVWFVFVLCTSEYRIYYIVLSIGIVSALFDITWFFEGLEQFRLIVVRNSVFRLISVVCLFVFVKDQGDLLIYILILALSDFGANVSTWFYLKRFLIKVSMRDLRIKPHFKATVIYFIPNIAVSVYTILDRTLIGIITHDEAQNGYYQYANYIIGSAKSVVFAAINSVLTTRISYLFVEGKLDEIHQRIKDSLNYIFFMGFACCFGIMGVAKTFVPLFLGPGYEPVEYLLYILGPILLIIGVSNCLSTHYYTPVGKIAYGTRFVIAGAALNVVLNLILIPRLGAYGAAISTVIAEILITVLYMSFCEDYADVKILLGSGGKKLIAGAIMFVVVFAMNRLAMPALLLLILQIVVGAAIFVVIQLALRDQWTVGFVTGVLRKVKK